jgi:hypothetical protein
MFDLSFAKKMVGWQSLLRWSNQVAAPVLCSSRKISIGRQKVCTH